MFGILPSLKHVVVVQDLASRFLFALPVPSTKDDKVLPNLGDISHSYGNPTVHLLDNGAPFNSNAMESFAKHHNIMVRKIPHKSLSSNLAETFMKSSGNEIKVANYDHISEKFTLQNLLINYSDTSHPTPSIPPASMLFRDGMKGVFPRRCIVEKDTKDTRKNDSSVKKDSQNKLTVSKYCPNDKLFKGETIHHRNCGRTFKFDQFCL